MVKKFFSKIPLVSLGPERLVEMMQSRKINSSLLDKIKVNRVTNTAQQIKYLLKNTTRKLLFNCS